jgi:RNA polymerase sporulation-specific sigma factor
MKAGSMEAQHALIEHNLRLVAHIVKKYQNVEEETQELISIGTIGLIKAVMTYNDERGSRLATYAARCIDNAILSQMGFYLKKRIPCRRRITFGKSICSIPKTVI